MGHITLGVKHVGERSAGNLPAAFDVAGAGNVTMVAGRRAMAKAVEEPPEPRCARLFSTLLMREAVQGFSFLYPLIVDCCKNEITERQLAIYNASPARRGRCKVVM